MARLPPDGSSLPNRPGSLTPMALSVRPGFLRRLAILTVVLVAALTALTVKKVRALSRTITESNILPQDYVGPVACQDCHEDIYAEWQDHPHRRMNQNPGPETVRGDFGGAVARFPEGEAHFTTEGGTYFMTLKRGEAVVRQYRVTRTVGSKYMQFFIGVMTFGPEPKTYEAYTTEHKLPFSYWFRLQRWLPQNYFDPLGDDRTPDGKLVWEPFSQPYVLPWRSSCMVCHNTWPWLYRSTWPRPVGFPRPDEVVAWLPLWTEVSKTLRPDHAPPGPELDLQTAVDPDKHLVNLGISCEACHFGGRTHISENAEMSKLPRSALHGPVYRRLAQGKLAERQFETRGTCSECHSAQGRLFANGAAVGNSREAGDLSVGDCATKITCVDCHSPHQGKAAEQNHQQSLAACVQCHPQYQKADAALAHGGHGAQVKVDCLDCHMPMMAQGLNEVVHSHRISSPSNHAMLAVGSPNACNLCHLDRSVTWTVEQLNRKWKLKAPLAVEAPWAQWYPAGLDGSTGQSWLNGVLPANRLAAAAAYGRSPLGRAALPSLIRALEDKVAVNRVFATFAVGQVLGRLLSVEDYDVAADPAQRAKQIEALLAQQAPAP